MHKPSALWPLPPAGADSHVVPVVDVVGSGSSTPEKPGLNSGLEPSLKPAAQQNHDVEATTTKHSRLRVSLSAHALREVGLEEWSSKGPEPTLVELRSQIQQYATNE